jgi:hypothetical protein
VRCEAFFPTLAPNVLTRIVRATGRSPFAEQEGV